MVRVYNLRFKAFLLIFALFIVLMAGSVSAANTTCVVSVSSGGNASNNYNAEPFISADGRYVVFSSEATNLVPEDGNSCPDVFIRDTILNTTKRVSVSFTGGDADGGSYTPSISRDGRYVAFVSSATNLVSGDGNGCDDIFVRDMLLGVTTLISHPNGGESNGNSYAPSISGDGRYVAFVSSATNLVSGDGNGCDDVFVFDRTSDSMKRISLAVNGTEANSYSDTPSVNGDGRFIAFVSDASNLVTDDGNGCSDIFLYDQTLNKLLRISTASNGTESDGMSYEPSISGDGRYVAFTSYADNLVSDDTNWRKDVFVFDRISGSLERVSVSSTGQEAVTDSDHPSISADGRYVVFTSGYIRPRVALAAARFSHSYVDSLVPGDVNGFTDVFVRDRLLNTTQIVTMSWNGTGTDADSFGPSVNADGTKIAFGSWADNVVVDDNNGLPDIFLTSISAPLNVTGNLQPVIVRSGDKVTVTANVNNPAVSVTALILQKTYNLTQSSNGAWTLQYTVPGVSSGVYSVILTVLDSYGNTGTVDLNFTVDNTAPTVKGSVTPVTLRTGGNLTVKASSDSDTQSVTALILGKTYTLKKQADGTWTIPYTVSSGNGKYNVLLKAVDALGNTGSTTLTFTVNNPVVNPNHGTASTSTLPASSSTKTSLFPVSGSTIKSSSSSGTHGHTTGVSTVKGGSQSTVAGKVVFPVFGGGLSAISSSSSGLLDGFLSYAGNSWACNVKGSVYGGSAAFLENPFNPFFYQFYTWDKLIQAGQKAWTTGNVWDFFNYDFFHIYGYSNLDHTWGGENIKQVIKFFTGVDENGDLSVGSFLLLLVSVIPIGRLGTLAGKLLTKSSVLMKYWRKIQEPVTGLLRKLGIFTKDPVEAFLGVSSKLSSLLDPSLGLIPACLELVAGISGKEVLRKIIESSVYKRLFGYDTVKSVTTIFNPNSWNPNNIKKAWNETIESVVSNAKWLGSTVKDIGKKLIVEGKKLIPNEVKVATKKVVNKVKNTVNTVKKIVKNTAKTVKNTAVKIVKTAKKAVKTVKKVVKKTVKTVKKAAKKVVRTVKKVVKKTVRAVKKVAKKVVKTVKNTVKKAVNAVKNVGKAVGKILKWW